MTWDDIIAGVRVPDFRDLPVEKTTSEALAETQAALEREKEALARERAALKQANADLSSSRTAADDLKRKLADVSEKLRAAEATGATSAKAAAQMEQALALKKAEVQSLTQSLEQARARASFELAAERKAVTDLTHKVEELSDKVQAGQDMCEEHARVVAQRDEALAQRGAEIQALRSSLEQKEAQASAELGIAHKTVEDLTHKVEELSDMLRAGQDICEEHVRTLQDQAHALGRNAAEIEALRKTEEALKHNVEDVSKQLQAIQGTSAERLKALEVQAQEYGNLQKLVEDLESDKTDRLEAAVRDAKKYRGAEAMDFYDAVLTIKKLEDIYVADEGWSVTGKRDFDFSAPREGVRVIPLGHFNSGKTWLIDQLSGAELPKGVAVHTQGISVKEARADDLKIILLDTVGSNSPMDSLPKGAEAHDGAEAVLQELRVQEDFYRQVCFELGQVILLVVGQMSHKDQTDLVRLARQIRKDRVRKDIVVVHNLRDWDMDMLTHVSEKDGMNYVDRTKNLFGLSDGSLKVTIGTEEKTVIRHNGLFGAQDDAREKVVNVYHYYLTDHLRPCSCNRFVMQDMKAVITRSAGSKKSLAEEFAAAATKIQSRFASFTVHEPEIVFDSATSKFRIKGDISEGAYRMKPRDIGSYFTMESDDPPYNITLVPATLEKHPDSEQEDEEEGAESKQRRVYQLQIELPGLCTTSLEDIKTQFKRKDSGALRREQLEGERGKQLTVSFQAKLLNVPGSLADTVAKSSKGRKKELSPEPEKQEVTDLGTRHHFRDGARMVKVRLYTGIMDYDTSVPPIVTYLDGVLGVTLFQQV